jgi:tRNA dimethylallyltransferase
MGHAMKKSGSKTSNGKAVLIAGPTASGKSALALSLAERHGGVIINADSMQVYRDLRVITARPSQADEVRAPHLLYGHIDAADNYSVGRWCQDMQSALARAASAGRLPIVVGGTGLYFKALTQGLSAVPPTPPEIRAAVRARADVDGGGVLHAELARRDPAMAARLKPADLMRVSRALEVLEATGRSLSEWHRDGMPAILNPSDAVTIFLDVDRVNLRQRIDSRFDMMLEAGALDEVQALVARGLDPLLPVMKAHGVPWLRRHLTGEIGLQEAAEHGKQDTRRYTKRQVTWFRNQMSGWTSIKPDAALERIEQEVGG